MLLLVKFDGRPNHKMDQCMNWFILQGRDNQEGIWWDQTMLNFSVPMLVVSCTYPFEKSGKVSLFTILYLLMRTNLTRHYAQLFVAHFEIVWQFIFWAPKLWMSEYTNESLECNTGQVAAILGFFLWQSIRHIKMKMEMEEHVVLPIEE